MSTLAAMNGLVSLDITDTGITPDGLRLLEPLPSLKTLHLDDACIAAESVRSLQRMQPQNIEVAVSEGMGRRAHELLSVCKGPNIRGHHRDGYVLWAADLAWNQTLAGVVEAVVSEIGLDPQQAAQLLTALANSTQQDWGPSMPGPLPPVVSLSHSTALADRGMEIGSTNEFIGELQKDFAIDIYAVRRFAREKFTAGDVPKLLAAIRGAESEHEKHHYLILLRDVFTGPAWNRRSRRCCPTGSHVGEPQTTLSAVPRVAPSATGGPSRSIPAKNGLRARQLTRGLCRDCCAHAGTKADPTRIATARGWC